MTPVPRSRTGYGYTMVELIVTIGIAAVLAAVAMPRLVGRDSFDSRGFYDLALASVRFAQKTAIAWRRDVYVCVAANTLQVGSVPGCGTTITNPATGQPLTTNAPAGVTMTAANFSFDSGGRPNPNSPVTITFNTTVPGDPVRTIVVEAETGYVHP